MPDTCICVMHNESKFVSTFKVNWHLRSWKTQLLLKVLNVFKNETRNCVYLNDDGKTEVVLAGSTTIGESRLGVTNWLLSLSEVRPLQRMRTVPRRITFQKGVIWEQISQELLGWQMCIQITTLSSDEKSEWEVKGQNIWYSVGWVFVSRFTNGQHLRGKKQAADRAETISLHRNLYLSGYLAAVLLEIKTG